MTMPDRRAPGRLYWWWRRWTHPINICHLIGHRRELYNAGQYTDRRGRWRTRWHSRCKRCGTSDGGEVFREGLLEKLRLYRIRWALRERMEAFAEWRLTTCTDCRKPSVRFGKHVGDHSQCGDEIPF